MLEAFFDLEGRPLLTSITHFGGGGGGAPATFSRDIVGDAEIFESFARSTGRNILDNGLEW